jgi:monoamine oxidase
MSNSSPDTSRRRFLGAAGAAAASTLLAQAMTGAVPARAAAATGGLFRPAPGVGRGRTVAVLGAGPAGLASALRLSEAGFTVTVLEAQNRVGGRTLTARRGDRISELWDDGVRTQKCCFDQGLYLNLGAGRIPYHHQRVIQLCRSPTAVSPTTPAVTWPSTPHAPSGKAARARTDWTPHNAGRPWTCW